jgi:hypothetical protein
MGRPWGLINSTATPAASDLKMLDQTALRTSAVTVSLVAAVIF